METWSTVMTRVLVPLASDASSSMPPLGVTTAHTLVCLPMLRLVRDEVALILSVPKMARRVYAAAREKEARGGSGRWCGIIRPHSVVLAAAVLAIQAPTLVRSASSPRYSERESGAVSAGGPWALLARHGEKDEDNPGDIDLNQRGRIRAAAMAALLWPAEASRKDYAAPLPECLESSMPIALAAQVPDIHKIVRRCLETAQYFEQQAQKVAKWVKIEPFGVLDIDKLASWVWSQSLHTMGQPSSVSVCCLIFCGRPCTHAACTDACSRKHALFRIATRLYVTGNLVPIPVHARAHTHRSRSGLMRTCTR